MVILIIIALFFTVRFVGELVLALAGKERAKKHEPRARLWAVQFGNVFAKIEYQVV